MASEPLLNGLPLDQARKEEQRGGAGRRGDPFAQLPQPAIHVGGARSASSARLMGRTGDLTHSGVRVQTSAPAEGAKMSPSALKVTALKSAAFKPDLFAKTRPAGQQPSGFAPAGPVLWYRDKVRALLAKVPLGFNQISIIMFLAVLGLAVWLPITILSSIIGGVLNLLAPTVLAGVAKAISTLGSTIAFVACGYFLVDRIKGGARD
jgi:hypothetical protein